MAVDPKITLAPASDFLPQVIMAIAAIIIVVLVVAYVTSRIAGPEWDAIAVPLCVLIVLVGGVFTTAHFSHKADVEDEERISAALEQQLGYSHIGLHYRNFTASRDGSYVKGKVVHYKDDTYIVVLDSTD